MKKVKIVTDSTCCLPPELIKKYDISIIPVSLVIEGKAYRDCIDISLNQICDLIHDLKKQPTTSAISPGEFLTLFRELAQTTDSIVCIFVTKALTATQESAYQARRIIRPEFPDLNIDIIDSKTSAGALGFVCLEAAKAAIEGKTITEVAQSAREMIPRVVYLAALDTLKFMINMGRIPRGASSIGEILNVKPVIGFIDDTGLTEVVARARGKKNAMEKIVELLPRYAEMDRPLHVVLHYSVALSDAEELRDMITAKFRCAEVHLTPYSPVMVSATGPMVGISFYSD